jgi:hypothetical protein
MDREPPNQKESKKQKNELYNGNHNNLGRNLIENVKKDWKRR